MIEIRQVTLATAQAFKEVRLRALKDSPFAFGSTYEKESALSDAEWRQRVVERDGTRAITFLAWDNDHFCGISAGYLDAENTEVAHLVSVWVEPDSRKFGAGNLLIDSVIAWAKNRSVRQLRLMVTSNNSVAARFYTGLKFEFTGASKPFPNDPTVVLQEMTLAL